jgi:hypothetical protein
MILLKLISITSLLVLGWTIVTQPKMGLHFVRTWADKKKENGFILADSLFLCVWCQPSIWSLLGFGFAFGLGILNHLEWNLLLLYVLTVCGSSLLAGITWTIYETISQIHLYFKNLNEQE